MPETSFVIEVAGASVRGMLHLPEGDGPFPAVLWLHGFTGSHIESHRLFVEGARRLARWGIASLRVDFRGCGDSDGDSLALTIQSQVEDARAALASLASRPEIDAQHLAIVGFSLGAAIASQLSREPGLAALTFWSPVVFPVPIFARLGLYAAHPELNRQGWIDANGHRISKAFLTQLTALDPLGALSGWDKPLYVLYGGEDSVATSENPEALLEEIEGAEGECLPNASHTFGTVKARTWLLDRTESWIAARLAGGIPVS